MKRLWGYLSMRPTSNYRLERAVMRKWLCAAGAGRQCAPAALIPRCSAAAQLRRKSAQVGHRGNQAWRLSLWRVPVRSRIAQRLREAAALQLLRDAPAFTSYAGVPLFAALTRGA